MTYQWNLLYEKYLKMCCSVDDCDADIFMMVVRCIVEKNKIFVLRVLIGLVGDGIEGLCIEFNESDKNINIFLLVSMGVLHLTLFSFILSKSCREEDVYTFNYVFFFKCISLTVAFIIFNTTSSFDRNTFEQLYIHFADGNFKDMFLTAMNFVSIWDMILNFFSLIIMFWKIERAAKEGKGTFRELFYMRLNPLSKSYHRECEVPNQQNVFSVNVEYPNAAN